MLCDLDAVPAVADARDPDQVAEAVARARPEVIVHQLTAIGALDMRHFDRAFALTNRKAPIGTDPARGRKLAPALRQAMGLDLRILAGMGHLTTPGHFDEVVSLIAEAASQTVG